jgi:glutamine synthetase
VADIDTIALAVPDAAGRLIGKRLTAAAWERVRADGEFSMPDFHLVTDADNVPIPDLPAAGLHNGFRNGRLRPDPASWRELPWSDRTGLVICDALDADGAPAERAPRWILRRQIQRLAERGITAGTASELEFYLLRTSYGDAADRGYRDLRAAYHRHGDNDLLVDGVVEPLLGDVRRLMPLAGIPIELSQGEGGIGQFEVTLAWSDPLEMADRHVVYKHGVKALGLHHGLAATFMAKFRDDQPGSSCHVHLSLFDADGRSLLSGGRGDAGALSPFGEAFLAGLLAYAPEFCLLFAPYANSYRRLQLGSWAPATVTWGLDNRTCLVRVCGEERARRIEFRLPGADTNPYLAFAGVIAAGLRGVDEQLTPPAPVTGDAYAADAPLLPRDLAEAIARFEGSAAAREALGDAVHEHIAALARHERDAVRREVTDRDLVRGFEVA